MNTIHRYIFEITDFFSIEMPSEAQILTAQFKEGVPSIWALVDTEKNLEIRHFRVIGTGNPVTSDKKLKYIDTIQNTVKIDEKVEVGKPREQITFVWHIFEEVV